MRADRAYRLIVTPRRARARAARRPRPRRPHRGRRDRRRRGRAVLGSARRTPPRGWRARCARTSRQLEPRSSSRAGVPWSMLMAEYALPRARRSRASGLPTMMLIRRFEERAGEMYARAKIGGFLHLSIGEEATIVGSARALRDSDYLISTYRSHGHALARGTPPEQRDGRAVRTRRRLLATGTAARCTCSTLERRFMGGYGIVGGNLPIAAGIALASDYAGTDEVTLCTFGDGASNQGTFGETLNLAALWRLPVVFMVVNNQFGMGTSLRRHSAVTDLQRKGESLGVPGMRCDGMDVLDTHAVVRRGAGARARGPPAAARRGRHLPLPRPLDGRPRGVPHQGGGRPVARARPDPRVRRPACSARGCSTQEQREQIDARGDGSAWSRRSSSPSASPFPPPESLYDDVYVLDDQAAGTRRRPTSEGSELEEPGAERALAPRRPRRPTTRSPSSSPRRWRRERTAASATRRWPDDRSCATATPSNAALREEMLRDESVVLLGEDIGVFGGAFKVTDGLLEEFGERRVRDTPISENTIVGIGRRRRDDRPAPGGGADDDQLLPARVRPDRQPCRPHPLHVRRPGDACRSSCGCRRAPGTSSAPPTRTASRRCSCTSPACSSPSPRQPPTRKGLLKTAIRDENPVIFIEHESLYGVRGEVPDGEEELVALRPRARSRARAPT